MPRRSLRRHLVGADVEPPIDRRRIAADDFAAVPQRQLDAERALAGGGGTQDRKNREQTHEAGPKHRSAGRAAAGESGAAMPSPVIAGRRLFVVEERHREERPLGRVLRRQRLRGIGRQQRVDRGAVERIDARRPLHFDVRDRAVRCTLNVITTCPFIIIAAEGMNQLRFTCATNRRSHGPNSTPLLSN